jgi:hypothetical protein
MGKTFLKVVGQACFQDCLILPYPPPPLDFMQFCGTLWEAVTVCCSLRL